MLLGSTGPVSIVDSWAKLAGLSFPALKDKGVDILDFTENAATLSASQASTVFAASLSFAAGDVVTLSDTGANVASSNFAALAAKGVDILDATDNAVTLSGTQAAALLASSLSLAAGD